MNARVSLLLWFGLNENQLYLFEDSSLMSYYLKILYDSMKEQKQFRFDFSSELQWGFDYQTSLVFEWSKRGWMPNILVFKCHLHTRQPDHLNTGQMDTILFNYVLVGYSNGWSST